MNSGELGESPSASRLNELIYPIVNIPLPSPEVNRRILGEGENPIDTSICNVCWTPKRVGFFYHRADAASKYSAECIWCQKLVKRSARVARREGFGELAGRREAYRQIRARLIAMGPDRAEISSQTTRHGHHSPFPPLGEDWVSMAACMHPSLAAARKCEHHGKADYLWSVCAHACLDGAPREWRHGDWSANRTPKSE